MIIKQDGSVDCVTTFEEQRRVEALIPYIVVRDVNGKQIPGILELNTETMDALLHLRVEGGQCLHIKDNSGSGGEGEVKPLRVRVCLSGCSIFKHVLDPTCGTYEFTEVLLDSKLLPVPEMEGQNT